ncbi:hypothetical protein CALVIDRAFT_566178 [Calocera viscosa TUFC12733]|uniref:DUF6535 domain-containing protein n=1 Tax=Calocera viscosa (strain TUFC12733) TaxID=1330018 RepID=A0A167JVI4_CALVF|nr:hypothetical protein CALVIDRAFT_566178 [Calocera viscosa TUFC12733]
MSNCDYEDDELIALSNQALDNFLLVITVFCAVVAPCFLVSISMLPPDVQKETLDTLLQISTHFPTNQTTPASPVIYPPEETSSNSYRLLLATNVLWLLALAISLVALILVMLIKQWSLNVRIRFRLPGDWNPDASRKTMRQWGTMLHSSLLPIFLHTAMALFLIGLILFTWQSNEGLGIMLTSLVGITAIAVPVFGYWIRNGL